MRVLLCYLLEFANVNPSLSSFQALNIDLWDREMMPLARDSKEMMSSREYVTASKIYVLRLYINETLALTLLFTVHLHQLKDL
jgi:hypothetical protein